jgi:hypothetical protein
VFILRTALGIALLFSPLTQASDLCPSHLQLLAWKLGLHRTSSFDPLRYSPDRLFKGLQWEEKRDERGRRKWFGTQMYVRGFNQWTFAYVHYPDLDDADFFQLFFNFTPAPQQTFLCRARDLVGRAPLLPPLWITGMNLLMPRRYSYFSPFEDWPCTGIQFGAPRTQDRIDRGRFLWWALWSVEVLETWGRPVEQAQPLPLSLSNGTPAGPLHPESSHAANPYAPPSVR